MTAGGPIPRPTPAFRLGVVGNRSLERFEVDTLAATTAGFLADLRAAIDASLATIAESPNGDVYAPGDLRLFLVNSLAEGADQLVADVAIAHEHGYRVRCPIPFTRETYKAFFTYDRDTSIERFDRITSDPDNDPIVVELASPSDGTDRSASYAAAADILIDNSDLVFALYDFSRVGSEGGTAETVQKALQAGLPVVGLDSRKPHEVVLLRAEGTNRALTPGLLRDIVARILVPPKANGLSRFLREPLVTGGSFTKTALRLLAAGYGALWSLVTSVGAIGSRFRPDAGHRPRDADADVEVAVLPTDQIAEQARTIAQVQQPYFHSIVAVDALAGFYMSLYRGSFVMNYLFGAFAVLFGLLSYFNHGNASSWLCGEVFVLGVIATNVVFSRVWRWRGRALDYRFIAEHQRQMMMLAPLGRSVPLVRPAAHYHGHDPTESWMVWYVRALDRARGLVDLRARGVPTVLRMDTAFLEVMRRRLSRDWLVRQLRYYRKIETRFTAAAVVLRGLMLLLFLITATGAAAHFMHVTIPLDSERWRDGAVITIIVAALPAFLGALHGITVQGELEVIAERARDMIAHLVEAVDEMNRREGAEPFGAIELSRRAVAAAHMMLSEVLDWRIMHQAHEVALT